MQRVRVAILLVLFLQVVLGGLCVADCPFLPGESVDDCGGGYSESIAEICEELQNGLTPLLIVTPNGRDESGANRDCYLLNPATRAPVHCSMFRFLGGPRLFVILLWRASITVKLV